MYLLAPSWITLDVDRLNTMGLTTPHIDKGVWSLPGVVDINYLHDRCNVVAAMKKLV